MLQTERVQTLADVSAVIDGNGWLDYQFIDREAVCEFIRRTLVRFVFIFECTSSVGHPTSCSGM